MTVSERSTRLRIAGSMSWLEGGAWGDKLVSLSIEPQVVRRGLRVLLIVLVDEALHLDERVRASTGAEACLASSGCTRGRNR
jgi:hypothetical protein